MNHPNELSAHLTESAGLNTEAMPVSLYTDPAQYEIERERIFRRAWLMVGRIERIPNRGDFFVKDIAVLKASVIIAHSEDGKIHAFHNVCAHRANIVEHRHEFWPTSATSTVWEARFYFKKPRTVRERLQREHFTSHITDTMLEDLGNIESMQRGMESGARSFIHFNESEILCRHGLEQVVKWSAATSARDALA